jgi:PKD repeat protein
MNIRLLLLSIILLIFNLARAQNDSLKVLFLGNSYTASYNLPQIVADLSATNNKSLIFDSHTPGGNLLWYFANPGPQYDITAINKIKSTNWDYIILQEQSTVPTIDHYRYNYMYPAIQSLYDSITFYNECSKVVLFMTWGRQNGGIFCSPDNYCSPDFTDFNHMQDSLESAYTEAADLDNILVAPVGIAWKNVLNDTNLVLHSADESHPNYHGSYLAANVFYNLFWQEKPQNHLSNSNISIQLANYLGDIADSTVFKSNSNWNMDAYNIVSDFSFSTMQNTTTFLNHSQSRGNADYLWDFGDSNSDTVENPQHTYNNDGNYLVKLETKYCNATDTSSNIVQILWNGVNYDNSTGFAKIYPNPASSKVFIEVADLLEIWIYNSNGELIHKQFENTINLNDFSKGTFILKIKTKTETIFKSLIKI